MHSRSGFWKHFLGTMVVFIVISALVIVAGRRWGELQPADRQTEECTTTGFAFDTVYTITLYQGGSQKILDACVHKCAEYEQIFSRTQESSELYRINLLSDLYAKEDMDTVSRLRTEGSLPSYECLEDGSLEIQISVPMAELITEGIQYGTMSQGSFDITIEPVSSLWNFTAENPVLPDRTTLEKALSYVDYTGIEVQRQKLRIRQPGTGLDLGGIAKGYIADQLGHYLTDQGVTSALISLGGNILCIGEKPDGGVFRIGVQHPFADRNKTIETVAIRGQSVVSSGIYERYFTDHDTIYHHILDPKTGFPIENDLMAVTIISERSIDGDGLSTTCFALGLQDGMKLMNQREGVTALFITKDEKLHYAEGFQEYLVSQ